MPDHTINYGDRLIRFTVFRKPTIHNKIAIHVQPDARVIVDAPSESGIAEIKRAVTKRAAWVTKNVANTEKQLLNAEHYQYVSGETHWYLGRRYLLKTRVARTERPNTKLTHGQLQLTCASRDPNIVRDVLDAWYARRARIVFEKRIMEVASKCPWIKTTPVWKIRSMKKQWGSCSPKGVVSLNRNLIKAPTDCIDYVVLHELCHLKHHDHSKGFYKLLDRSMPNWRDVKLRLDSYAEVFLS